MAVPKHIAVVDSETTGIDPKECMPVEVAAYSEWNTFETLIDPKIPIPPETSAVHHICDDDVEGAPTKDEALSAMAAQFSATGVTVLAAHNVDYDKRVFHPYFQTFPWICTYKCALWVWPDAPSHKNEALCYWLRLGDLGRKFQQGTHSALHDAKKTYLLLNELLKHASEEQLIKWTTQPKNIIRMAFGKHAGKLLTEIDAGYLRWMVNTPDMDADYKYAADKELKRRGGK